MTLVIGTDEAGYGPNLGPLVVAATAWEIDAPPEEAEASLSDAVARAHAVAADLGVSPPLWGDSKEIYRGGNGLERLEFGVLVAGSIAAGESPAAWRDLERLLGPLGPPDGASESPEWPGLTDAAVPSCCAGSAVADAAHGIAAAMRPIGVRLAAMRCRCVYPGGFNDQLLAGRNKSDILSTTTLSLAASLTGGTKEATVVWCDRHGGRKRYAGIVSEAFDAAFVQPIEETATRSSYCIGGGPSATLLRTTIEFAVGGESRLPVALASMTAKYIRERTMECFNRFWSARLPGLRPTAGYPLDAKRWRADASGILAAEEIAERVLWRRA